MMELDNHTKDTIAIALMWTYYFIKILLVLALIIGVVYFGVMANG